jgi:hypothetical protein
MELVISNRSRVASVGERPNRLPRDLAPLVVIISCTTDRVLIGSVLLLLLYFCFLCASFRGCI